MVMYGADVAALRQLASRFNGAAQQLHAVRAALSRVLAEVSWTGPDAARFRSEWAELESRLARAAAGIEGGAASLTSNASEQEQTSGGAETATGLPSFDPSRWATWDV